jgi:YebC/PmpR family DNA-binding regulatory protein
MGRMFEARKHTIFARNTRIAKQFTRVSREIVISVKAGGPDPANNPALRRAIQNGRAVSMPKDKIHSAIERAMGVGGEDYREIVYEGYGPSGVPMMVVTTTDNPTRTVANVRMHFKKNGGNLGNSGSVAFMFNRMGLIRLKPDGIDPEELELEMIDFGLEDLVEGEDDNGNALLILRCAFNDFGDLQSGVEDRGMEPVSTGSEFVPTTFMDLDEEQEAQMLKLVEVLEGDDDVQEVFHNVR